MVVAGVDNIDGKTLQKFLSSIQTASLKAQLVNHLPAMQDTQVRFLGREDPLKKKWQPTPVFLPGESHEQRSLTGYSPWDRKSWT